MDLDRTDKGRSERRPIKLFNYGKMRCDFTYIDDVARVTSRLVGHVPKRDDRASGAGL